MFAAPPVTDQRRYARSLYWQRWKISDIAEHIGKPRTTVDSWRIRGKWDDAPVIAQCEDISHHRWIQLMSKDQWTGSDVRDIDLLGRQLERMARIRRYGEPGGHEGDLNPRIENRNAKPKRKPQRNVFSPAQQARFRELFHERQFDYQRVWHAAGLEHRIRDILKSRQIGATFFFSSEALEDGLETGRNQIFLSASKAQAHVFRQYIVEAAREVDVDLTGDPIVLPNEAAFYFLGTNARTAQSYHGNLYVDEYFWIQRFLELRKVASGMAMHKKWRQTYFSTPSTLTHEAYQYWTGAVYNKGRKKEDRVKIDIDHSTLRNGLLCADGQWRQIVTVLDAVAAGCDLFDVDQLRMEYGPEEWANLLMCEFIDDSASVYSFAEMSACMVDSWEVWEDIKPHTMRPIGNAEVWLGYDPALEGDGAALVALAAPPAPGGKFRMLERHMFRGMDFTAQAAKIKEVTQRYRVTYIGIDTTGLGLAVFPIVQQFFPAVTRIDYSPEVKYRLVLKGKDVISKGRLEYDAGWSDVTQAFMSIRREMTASGRQSTFNSRRSEETGHADVAWATLHALLREPIEAGSGQRSRSVMEMF